MIKFAPVAFALLFLVQACGAMALTRGLETTTSAAPRAKDSLLIDALGQLYVWGADQSITKKLAPGDATKLSNPLRYQNVRLGKLQSIDLTNPLRPVLFYGESQQVVWLDRNLAEIRSLNLVDEGYSFVDAISYAPNDGLWMFERDLQQLLHVDRLGQVVARSQELSQLFNGQIVAKELVAINQKILLATEDGRILIFGPFAAFQKQLIQSGSNLLVSDEGVLFFSDGWFFYEGDGAPIREIKAIAGQRLLMMRGNWALWENEQEYWRERLAKDLAD